MLTIRVVRNETELILTQWKPIKPDGQDTKETDCHQGVLVHTYKPSTQEGEEGYSFEASLA